MAFVPAKRQIAAAPISVRVYDDDGREINIQFVAQYRRYKKDEIDDLGDALNNKFRILRGEDVVKRPDGTVPQWEDVSDVDFIRNNLRGWSGVKDETGADIPYSADALKNIVDDYPELVQPLFAGLFDAHRGAKQKN